MSSDDARNPRIARLGILPRRAVAGCDPEIMGIGPIYAIPKLLKRHNLEISDIGPVGDQ